jgi:signal peptidase I
MLQFLKNKYFKFGFWSLVYLLFVLWIGSWWLIFGILVIFDFYITKYVNWTFWKKRDLEKKSKWIEWVDALVFAVIAASIIRIFFIEAYMIPTSSMEKTLLVGDYLFVSKYSYGPKMPNTPLAIPFTHHTLPGTKSTKPYLEWVQRPYKRLAGLSDIKRDDIVVFNFPEGDTVAIERQTESYYGIIRLKAEELMYADRRGGQPVKDFDHYYNIARTMVKANYEIVSRPVDKRENYIKRCVAIAGDTLEIVDGQVIVNGKEQKDFPGIQYKYSILTEGRGLNVKKLRDMGISNEDITVARRVDLPGVYRLPLTDEMARKISRFKNVMDMKKSNRHRTDSAWQVFPHSLNYDWTQDNFGPLVIPKKGVSVKLDTVNLPIYERIINAYEANDLRTEGGKIYINDEQVNSYTFQMNYYFLMGDSRHNSLDSRFWGFVPEDHVVGKALFLWMSMDPDKSLLRGKIRFDRLFTLVKHE